MQIPPWFWFRSADQPSLSAPILSPAWSPLRLYWTRQRRRPEGSRREISQIRHDGGRPCTGRRIADPAVVEGTAGHLAAADASRRSRLPSPSRASGVRYTTIILPSLSTVTGGREQEPFNFADQAIYTARIFPRTPAEDATRGHLPSAPR